MKNTILKVLSVVLILTLALTAVLGLTGCNEEIKEDIAKNEAGLEEANNALKTANAAIAKLQADLEKLSGATATQTGLDAAIADLQGKIADNAATLATLNTALQNQATESANALDAKATELQAKITAAEGRLTALEGEAKDALLDEINANKTAIAALQTAAAALRTDVDAAATQAAVDAAIEVVQGQIQENATQLAALVEQLATVNTAIENAKTTLNASIKAVSDAVDALDSTYATDEQLANEIKALKEGEIKTLQDAVTLLSGVSIDGDGLVAAIDSLRDELKPLIDEFGDNYNNATDILNGETVLVLVYNEETETYDETWVKAEDAVDGEEYSIDAFKELKKERVREDFTDEVFDAYEEFCDIQEFKLGRALTGQQILDIFGALKAYQDPENMKSILDVFKGLVATVKANGITVAQAEDGELIASDYSAEDANAPIADGMGIDEFFDHFKIADRDGYIADEDGVKTDYEAIKAARDNLKDAETDAKVAAAAAVAKELYYIDAETGEYKANEVLYYPGVVDANIDDVKALYDAIKDNYFADADMNVFYADDVLDELTGYTFNVEQQAAWNHLVDAKDALDDEIAEKFETIPVINEWPLYSDYEGISADIAVVDAWAAAQEIEVDSKNYQLILTASLAANEYAPKDYKFVKHVEVYSATMKAIYNNMVLGVTFGEGETAKNLAAQIAVEIEGGAENVLFVRIPVLYNINDAISALRDQIKAVDGYSSYHEEVIQIEKDEYDELYAAIEWPAGLKYLQVEDKGTPETEDDEYFKAVEVIDDKNFDTMLGMADDKWAIYDDIRAKVVTLEKAKYGDLGALEDLYIKGIDGLTEVLDAKIGKVSYSDGAKITTGYKADLNAIFVYHGIMYAEESEEDINYVNYVAMTTDFRTNLATLKDEYDHLTDKVQAVYDEVAEIVKNAKITVLTDLQKILWANKRVTALTGVDTPDFTLKEVKIDEETGKIVKDDNGKVVYAKDVDGEQVYIPYTDFSNQLQAKLMQLVALAEAADGTAINAHIEALGEYDLNKTEQFKETLVEAVQWLETYLGINIDAYFGESYDPATGAGAPAVVADPGELKEREDEDDPTWDAIVLDHGNAVADYQAYLADLATYTETVYRPEYIRNNMAEYLPALLDAAKVYFINADETGSNQGILNITNYKYKAYKYSFVTDFQAVIDAAEDYIELFAAAQNEWFGYDVIDEETNVATHVNGILDDVAALPELGYIHIHDIEISAASERYAAYVEAYYENAITNAQFAELTTFAALKDRQDELDDKIEQAKVKYEDLLREAQDTLEAAAGVPAESEVIDILAKVDDLMFHISEYRDLYCDGKHKLCEKQCSLIGIAQFELPYNLTDSEKDGYKLSLAEKKAKLEKDYLVTDLDVEPVESDYDDSSAYTTAWNNWNDANAAYNAYKTDYNGWVAANEKMEAYNAALVEAGDIDIELIAYQAKAKALAVKVFADNNNKEEITYMGMNYELTGDGDKLTLKTRICSDMIDARTDLLIAEDNDRPATTAEKIKAVKDDYNFFLGLLLDQNKANLADYAIDPVLVP